MAALARASFPTLTRLRRMIGVSSSSRSFKSLGHYLVAGRGGEEPNRVAWSTARNLPTDDPQLAAKIMRATATQNVRVDQPVYHLALSFDPRDLVDRQQMERVADRVLIELGLREYQSLIVAHRDRQHSHLHILINRIHPVSHKAWDRWQDYPIVQRVLRDEERALGLHQMDVGVEKWGKNTTREKSGQTMRLTRAEYFAQRRSLSQIRDDLTAHESETERHRLRYSAELSMASSEARATQLDGAIIRVQRQDELLVKALGAVYRDPTAAKVNLFQLAHKQGPEIALRRLRQEPEILGELREDFAAAQRIRTALRRFEPLEAAIGRGRDLFAARRELISLLERETGLRVLVIDESLIADAKAGVQSRLACAREEVRALRATAGDQTLTQLEFRLSQGIRQLAPPEFARLCLMLSGSQLSLANKFRGIAREIVLGREDGR